MCKFPWEEDHTRANVRENPRVKGVLLLNLKLERAGQRKYSSNARGDLRFRRSAVRPGLMLA